VNAISQKSGRKHKEELASGGKVESVSREVAKGGGGGRIGGSIIRKRR